MHTKDHVRTYNAALSAMFAISASTDSTMVAERPLADFFRLESELRAGTVYRCDVPELGVPNGKFFCFVRCVRACARCVCQVRCNVVGNRKWRTEVSPLWNLL